MKRSLHLLGEIIYEHLRRQEAFERTPTGTPEAHTNSSAKKAEKGDLIETVLWA